MNMSLNTGKQMKKQETLMLILLGLTLALVWLFSKFVLGINFGLMENKGYISFGYHEVRGQEIWALSFDSFSGSISAQGKFPENSKNRLLIHSGTENTTLELALHYGDTKDVYILDGDLLDLTLPDETDTFTMTLSGTDVISGYFSAVWE